MKVKSLGALLAIGVIGATSLPVFAQTTDVKPVSSNVEYYATSNQYDEIKQMIDQKVAAGELTEDEGEALLDYCSRRMNRTSNGNRRLGNCCD